MTGNFDINKELLDAMRIIARQEIEKCNRDITKTARVINVNNDKTVKIEMNGKQYDNIPNYNGTTLSVNNIVKVTYPQGQVSNMYVSGGGEDEIYSNLPYIDTSKKIKDGFANGTSWTATDDCIVCGSIGFNGSAQGCNVLINGINIFWVNNDVTVNSSMPIWFSVRKGDTVRFIGYNNQVPILTNLYAFSTK